ncbi:MAG: hypothetical protein K2O98_00485, partial [Lachnospiraceae bacterium]|nr:hypothetical protein [Lachnospiraceae bacterium]
LCIRFRMITIFFRKDDMINSDAPLRIGAGADISGILMEETVEELNGICMIPEDLESSSFQDC